MNKHSSRYNSLKSRLAQEFVSRTADAAPNLARETNQHDNNELTLQGLWSQQAFFGDALMTCSGKSLKILNPGQWNRSAGPDFRRAEIVIDGQEIRGDIEIHLRASDWHRHRHGHDFEYNRVILHVFLERDDGETFDELHNGGSIERLHLAPFLAEDLESLQQLGSLEEVAPCDEVSLGYCHRAFAQLEAGFVREFFEEAGKQRMEAKISRFIQWQKETSRDQAFYQLLLTGLGHPSNRSLFFILAKRLPIGELREIFLFLTPSNLATALEAAFLHVGGLLVLPDDAGRCEGSPLDPSTVDYLESLHKEWQKLAGYFHDRMMSPSKRWHAGVRPTAFPERRLAGIARVLVELDFLRGLVEGFWRRVRESMLRMPRSERDLQSELSLLAAVFAAEDENYWTRRFTFDGRPTTQRIHLIGKSCAQSLVFNAVLPALFAFAREQGDTEIEDYLWKLYSVFPALQTNSVTRFMSQRILSALPAGTVNLRYEKNQQALLQVFYDCCQSDANSCAHCSLLPRIAPPDSDCEGE
jgi:hypothetical protein